MISLCSFILSAREWSLTYELSASTPDTMDLEAIGGVKGSCLMTVLGEIRVSSCASWPSVECGGDGGRAVAELNAIDARK